MFPGRLLAVGCEYPRDRRRRRVRARCRFRTSRREILHFKTSVLFQFWLRFGA